MSEQDLVPGGGSGGTPGGSSGQVQFNSSSSFGGIPNSIVNATTGATQLLPLTVAVSATTKTLGLTDAETIQDCSNASAQTVTIPTNANVAFPVGTVIQFEQNGAGALTIQAAGGVTLNGNVAGTATAGGQFTAFYIRQESADVWYAVGISGGSGSVVSCGITIDGGGSAIVAGSYGYTQIPYACTLTAWTVLADQSGSCTFDVKRSTYSGFPSTTSLVGSGNAPLLSSVQKNTAAPSGWTSVTIAAGDVLEFSISGITSVMRVNLILKLVKT